MRDGKVFAHAVRLAVTDDDHAWYAEVEKVDLELREFDAVLMRRDPPSGFRIRTRPGCSNARSWGAKIFNDPRGDSWPRKARDHRIPATATLVAHDAVDLNAFIDEFADVVLKTLDGMGGKLGFPGQAGRLGRAT